MRRGPHPGRPLVHGRATPTGGAYPRWTRPTSPRSRCPTCDTAGRRWPGPSGARSGRRSPPAAMLALASDPDPAIRAGPLAELTTWADDPDASRRRGAAADPPGTCWPAAGWRGCASGSPPTPPPTPTALAGLVADPDPHGPASPGRPVRPARRAARPAGRPPRPSGARRAGPQPVRPTFLTAAGRSRHHGRRGSTATAGPTTTRARRADWSARPLTAGARRGPPRPGADSSHDAPARQGQGAARAVALDHTPQPPNRPGPHPRSPPPRLLPWPEPSPPAGLGLLGGRDGSSHAGGYAA